MATFNTGGDVVNDILNKLNCTCSPTFSGVSPSSGRIGIELPENLPVGLYWCKAESDTFSMSTFIYFNGYDNHTFSYGRYIGHMYIDDDDNSREISFGFYTKLKPGGGTRKVNFLFTPPGANIYLYKLNFNDWEFIDRKQILEEE